MQSRGLYWDHDIVIVMISLKEHITITNKFVIIADYEKAVNCILENLDSSLFSE